MLRLVVTASGTQPNPGAAPVGTSWTAMVVEVQGTTPTFFNKVMGVSTMSTGARATAVHRPVDVAVTIDITGSMRFGSSCSATGIYLSEILHGTNGQYSLETTPNPGSGANGFAGITAIPGGGLWAVGITSNKTNNSTLIAHHC